MKTILCILPFTVLSIYFAGNPIVTSREADTIATQQAQLETLQNAWNAQGQAYADCQEELNSAADALRAAETFLTEYDTEGAAAGYEISLEYHQARQYIRDTVNATGHIEN